MNALGLNPSQVAGNLGVIVDSDFSYKAHVCHVTENSILSFKKKFPN